MIVHIASPAELLTLTDSVTEDMEKLARAFWPGPLTMVVAAKPAVSRITTTLDRVFAVRMPDNEITLRLIEKPACRWQGRAPIFPATRARLRRRMSMTICKAASTP